MGGRRRPAGGRAGRCDSAAGARVAVPADRHLRRGPDAVRADRPDDADPEATARAGAPAEPLLGRPLRRRQAQAGAAREPRRPGLRLVALRSRRPVRERVRHARALLDLRHAGVGERRARPEPRPDERDRPAQLRLRGCKALRGRVPRRPGRPPPTGPRMARLERAEQSPLPRAAVQGHRDPERDRLHEDLQRDLRRRARDAVQRRARGLRRHRPARQQQSE